MFISIHAPHAGCDKPDHNDRQRHDDFNPRTPCGVRPAIGGMKTRFINISIHAPHAGCDDVQFGVQWAEGYFNPRTPCGVRQNPLYLA